MPSEFITQLLHCHDMVFPQVENISAAPRLELDQIHKMIYDGHAKIIG